MIAIHPEPAPLRGALLFAAQWPSRVDWKQQVIDTIATTLTSRGWVLPDDEPWLGLCLDEVVVNAMLHGNEGDPQLNIDVELRRDGALWVLTVADQGEGFTADTLPDPEDPASLLLEHGRGIRLMREWLHELTYWRGGATALLARRIPDGA